MRIELISSEPESGILSIELRAHFSDLRWQKYKINGKINGNIKGQISINMVHTILAATNIHRLTAQAMARTL